MGDFGPFSILQSDRTYQASVRGVEGGGLELQRILDSRVVTVRNLVNVGIIEPSREHGWLLKVKGVLLKKDKQKREISFHIGGKAKKRALDKVFLYVNSVVSGHDESTSDAEDFNPEADSSMNVTRKMFDSTLKDPDAQDLEEPRNKLLADSTTGAADSQEQSIASVLAQKRHTPVRRGEEEKPNVGGTKSIVTGKLGRPPSIPGRKPSGRGVKGNENKEQAVSTATLRSSRSRTPAVPLAALFAEKPIVEKKRASRSRKGTEESVVTSFTGRKTAKPGDVQSSVGGRRRKSFSDDEDSQETEEVAVKPTTRGRRRKSFTPEEDEDSQDTEEVAVKPSARGRRRKSFSPELPQEAVVVRRRSTRGKTPAAVDENTQRITSTVVPDSLSTATNGVDKNTVVAEEEENEQVDGEDVEMEETQQQRSASIDGASIVANVDEAEGEQQNQEEASEVADPVIMKIDIDGEGGETMENKEMVKKRKASSDYDEENDEDFYGGALEADDGFAHEEPMVVRIKEKEKIVQVKMEREEEGGKKMIRRNLFKSPSGPVPKSAKRVRNGFDEEEDENMEDVFPEVDALSRSQLDNEPPATPLPLLTSTPLPATTNRTFDLMNREAEEVVEGVLDTSIVIGVGGKVPIWRRDKVKKDGAKESEGSAKKITPAKRTLASTKHHVDDDNLEEEKDEEEEEVVVPPKKRRNYVVDSSLEGEQDAQMHIEENAKSTKKPVRKMERRPSFVMLSAAEEDSVLSSPLLPAVPPSTSSASLPPPPTRRVSSRLQQSASKKSVVEQRSAASSRASTPNTSIDRNVNGEQSGGEGDGFSPKKAVKINTIRNKEHRYSGKNEKSGMGMEEKRIVRAQMKRSKENSLADEKELSDERLREIFDRFVEEVRECATEDAFIRTRVTKLSQKASVFMADVVEAMM